MSAVHSTPLRSLYVHPWDVASRGAREFAAQASALGMTLRVFNLEEQRWYLYWINSSTGQLFPPVAGGFDGDRGEFYGEDRDEGRPVKVRFRWTRIDADRARWEQAFSLDGKQWETNWKMEHTRVGA